MEIKGRHIVVAGLGKTGRALVRFLVRRGARLTVTDSSSPESLKDALAKLSDLADADLEMALGGHDDAVFQSADTIVLSPGVPHTLAPVRRAALNGIPVIGEIELAYRYMNTPIIAITGTNGKSTTTLLTGRMLSAAGYRVFVGGNLGTPLIAYADQGDSADFAVVELSSFQLDTIERFRPRVSLLLNISADHLERYPDFDAYVRSKGRIFENQTEADIAVINKADPAIKTLKPKLSAQVFSFNADASDPAGAVITDADIRFSLPRQQPYTLDCLGIPLMGRHNRENIAAAGLAAAAVGASFEAIRQTVESFQGLSHRMMPVASIEGVDYIDDSKATNVDAVVRALASFSTPVILIMGGREKGGSYKALKDQLPGCVRHLILLGEAADAIEHALGDAVPASRVSSMAEAVQAAKAIAVEGDTVLLSPACASFDMYESYARRGEDFVKCVREKEAAGNE